MGVACLRTDSSRKFSASHANTRTTVLGRLLIVERHRAGWPQAHIAAAMGISGKWVKTWWDRYAAEGVWPGETVLAAAPECRPGPVARSSNRSWSYDGAPRPGLDRCRARVPTRTVSRALTRNDVPHRNTKVGYDYVHSLVDDYSRLAYSEAVPDERAPPAPGS